MSREPQSFVVFAGEDVSIPITVTDNDGNVVDLTGGSVRFAAARRVGGTAVLDSGASPATATAVVTTPASGLITVSLADTDTDDLLGTYAWQVKFTDSSSNETVVAHGFVTFKARQI